MSQPPTIYLDPPPIPRDGLDKFTASNRTIKSALAPLGAELAVWVSPKDQTLAQVRSGKESADLETSSGLVQLGGKRAFGPWVDEKRGEGSKGVFEQDKRVYFARYTGAEAELNRVSARRPDFGERCRRRVPRCRGARRVNERRSTERRDLFSRSQ
jgi:hypothetical protein